MDGAKVMLAVCCNKKALKQNSFKPFQKQEKGEKKKYRKKICQG